MNILKQYDRVRVKKSYAESCGVYNHTCDYYVWNMLKIETDCHVKYIANIVNLTLLYAPDYTGHTSANIDIKHLYNTREAFCYYLRYGKFPKWSE